MLWHRLGMNSSPGKLFNHFFQPKTAVKPVPKFSKITWQMTEVFRSNITCGYKGFVTAANGFHTIETTQTV